MIWQFNPLVPQHRAYNCPYYRPPSQLRQAPATASNARGSLSPGTYHWKIKPQLRSRGEPSIRLLSLEQFRSAVHIGSQEVVLHPLKRHKRAGSYSQNLQVRGTLRFLGRIPWPESTKQRMNRKHPNVDTNLCFRYSFTLHPTKNTLLSCRDQ
jgi:hypothetical protein